jgi:hypothetical protein
MATYVTFRTAIPKPAGETAHLRHILRFCAARALAQEGREVLILPAIMAGDRRLTVDKLTFREAVA